MQTEQENKGSSNSSLGCCGMFFSKLKGICGSHSPKRVPNQSMNEEETNNSENYQLTNNESIKNVNEINNLNDIQFSRANPYDTKKFSINNNNNQLLNYNAFNNNPTPYSSSFQLFHQNSLPNNNINSINYPQNLSFNNNIKTTNPNIFSTQILLNNNINNNQSLQNLRQNSEPSYYEASASNIYDANITNYNDPTFNNNFNQNISLYRIESYSAYTITGTDSFGEEKEQNQDTAFIKSENVNMNFGVSDGHGTEGHIISQAVKQYFEQVNISDHISSKKLIYLCQNCNQYISKSKDIASDLSGSTLIMVSITPNKIYVTNIGDSRAILIDENSRVVKLSKEHKPDLEDEKKRIESCGGSVAQAFGEGPFRVFKANQGYPGLAMSRSIGDKVAHSCGVIDKAEVKEMFINDIKPAAIIIGSDGLFEFFGDKEIKKETLKFIAQIVASIATAILTALGATSCMGAM